mmetsp:Transcript_18840/g.55879  ORF Transcript_18840/g.55879 Transcript_18840/m.55879 type:complete len:223 (-) Transcript_18840:1058-1726(-)
MSMSMSNSYFEICFLWYFCSIRLIRDSASRCSWSARCGSARGRAATTTAAAAAAAPRPSSKFDGVNGRSISAGRGGYISSSLGACSSHGGKAAFVGGKVRSQIAGSRRCGRGGGSALRSHEFRTGPFWSFIESDFSRRVTDAPGIASVPEAIAGTEAARRSMRGGSACRNADIESDCVVDMTASLSKPESLVVITCGTTPTSACDSASLKMFLGVETGLVSP